MSQEIDEPLAFFGIGQLRTVSAFFYAHTRDKLAKEG